jgi:nuclease S1
MHHDSQTGEPSVDRCIGEGQIGISKMCEWARRCATGKLPRVKRLAVAIVLLIPSLLFAWGGDGHQITALIAEEHLNPETKKAIHELLGKDVNISDAEICNWADQIRRERRSTAPWHYVDIPADASDFDEERDGNHGNNVVDKLEHFEKVLADVSNRKDDRAEALKFVVHFAGDIEQPLHCAERYHDRGGNTRLVFFLDRKRAVALHAVWDTQILLHDKGNQRILDYSRWLNEQITPDEIRAWSKGKTEDWANESHRVAMEQAYKDVPADGDPPKLGPEYVKRAEPVVEQQLQRGGIRLATILNRALDPIFSPPPRERP